MTENVLAYQAAALIGSIAAIAFGTVIPYYKKWLAEKEINGVNIEFNKKYLMTGGISFMFAVIAGVINFDNTISTIDYNSTILKVFVAAFVTGIGSNFLLNSYIKPSSTVVSFVKRLKAERKLD